MKFTKGIFASFLVFAFVFAAASTASAYTHMGTLKLGSSGSQVMELQKALNAKGFVVSTTGAGSPGMESTYFGAKTQGAVVAFQTANNLGKDGIVGNNTGAALAGAVVTGPTTPTPGCPAGAMYNSMTGALCSGTPTTPTTPTGPLAGSDGTIDDVSTITSYDGEDLGEGQDDVKIAGFEVEASNDGDIELKSLKLTFDPTGNATGDSDNLDDYISGVSIWMGSTKIGSADVDDFNENTDDSFSKTITLSGAIVRADETEKFYITVDAVGTYDSGDIDGTVDYSVGVESIRYMDGSGVTSTYSASSFTGGAADGVIGWDGVGDGISFDAVDFATAADINVKFTVDSDSPEAGIVIVDDSTVTNDVVLLKGEIEVEGDSDVVIDALPFSFSPVGDNITNMAEDLRLVINGTEKSESVASMFDGSTATITFDNLGVNVDAGDTISFEIIADIKGTDDFAEGDTLTASFTASNRAMADIEDEGGDAVAAGDRSGTATGEAQEFRSEGIAVTLVSTNKESSGDSDQIGTFTIRYKVKAVGTDVYVSSVATASLTTTGTGTVVGVERAGTATIGGVTTTVVNITDDDLTSGVGNYLVEEGTENTFEMVATVSLPAAGADGQFRALIRAIDWAITDTVTYNSYESNLDSFKTSYIALQ